MVVERPKVWRENNGGFPRTEQGDFAAWRRASCFQFQFALSKSFHRDTREERHRRRFFPMPGYPLARPSQANHDDKHAHSTASRPVTRIKQTVVGGRFAQPAMHSSRRRELASEKTSESSEQRAKERHCHACGINDFANRAGQQHEVTDLSPQRWAAGALGRIPTPWSSRLKPKHRLACCGFHAPPGSIARHTATTPRYAHRWQTSNPRSPPPHP